jgi:LysM repeat protein
LGKNGKGGKHNMKKLFSLLLTMVMVLSMAVPVLAARDSSVDTNTNTNVSKHGWYDSSGKKLSGLSNRLETKYPAKVYDTWKLNKEYTRVSHEASVSVGETLTLRFYNEYTVYHKSTDKLGYPNLYMTYPVNYDDGFVSYLYFAGRDVGGKPIEEWTYADLYKDGKDLYMEIQIKGLKEGVFELAYDLAPFTTQLFRINVVASKSGATTATPETQQKIATETPATSEQKKSDTNNDSTSKDKETTVATSSSSEATSVETVSTPADENTVTVAGTSRTPGKIAKFTTGDYCYTVNNGDTLYDLANRFYGDGNLWKELQSANQKYLDETADGYIFVGFNLVVPAELGGVRANIN